MFRAALQRRRKNSSPTVNFGNFPVTGIRAKGMLVSESQGRPQDFVSRFTVSAVIQAPPPSPQHEHLDKRQGILP